jgi:hypothetical protein
MARLRATASAARSVLDGCEHDGMLDRVGAAISDNQTIKSSPQKAIKKRADAYWPLSFLTTSSAPGSITPGTVTCTVASRERARTIAL